MEERKGRRGRRGKAPKGNWTAVPQAFAVDHKKTEKPPSFGLYDKGLQEESSVEHWFLFSMLACFRSIQKKKKMRKANGGRSPHSLMFALCGPSIHAGTE